VDLAATVAFLELLEHQAAAATLASLVIQVLAGHLGYLVSPERAVPVARQVTLGSRGPLVSAVFQGIPVLAGTLGFRVSRGSVDTADSREPPAYRDSLVRADIQAFPDTLASAGLLVQAVSVEHLAAVDIVVFQVIQVLVDIQEHLA
jgi:hypothetical protein